MTASFTTHSTPEEVVFAHRPANRWFLSPEITGAALKYGAATQKLTDDLRIAFGKWKEHPSAFAPIAYGEAVANKPLSRTVIALQSAP